MGSVLTVRLNPTEQIVTRLEVSEWISVCPLDVVIAVREDSGVTT